MASYRPCHPWKTIWQTRLQWARSPSLNQTGKQPWRPFELLCMLQMLTLHLHKLHLHPKLSWEGWYEGSKNECHSGEEGISNSGRTFLSSFIFTRNSLPLQSSNRWLEDKDDHREYVHIPVLVLYCQEWLSSCKSRDNELNLLQWQHKSTRNSITLANVDERLDAGHHLNVKEPSNGRQL